jgi:hypothetical protein
MARKRNPIKQIMSDVHMDARAGKLDLSGHGGFIAEVKRRARAAGLADDQVNDLTSGREPRVREHNEERADPPS